MDNFEKVPKGIFDKVTNNKELFISEFKEKLEEVFPSAVKDGIVDFEALLNEFGQYAETDEKEKYNMTWVGKKDAIRKANEDIVGKTLKYVPEDSKNSDTTQNLYIEGDNLEVLKLLRNSYYGKVKMIYIDPPYNTGNDFVYNDTFKMDKEEYEKAIGDVDEYNERLTASKKGSGRFHSAWLNMMYLRLKVASSLLSHDGVIFISIDDNEVENLKKICNEIFGENNAVATLVWQKRTSPDARKKISTGHEYILVYLKNCKNNEEVFNQLSLGSEDKAKYKNPDDDPRGPWVSTDFGAQGYRPNQMYMVTTSGGKKYKPSEGRCWKNTEEGFKKLLAEGRMWFGKDGCGVPRKKLYLNERTGKNIWTWWSNDEVGHTQEATQYLTSLLGSKSIFDYSKPVRLLKRMVQIASKEDSIILDFFAGSATTADAVMQLNAEDGGNRKFIMVQIPESCDKTSDAYKKGYKNICEIGKERIRRAGDKILEENKDKEGIEKLDVGFKVFRVADTNIRWISDTLSQNISMDEYRNDMSLKDQLDFNPHFTDIDVVYEMMLKRQDIELTERIDNLEDIGDRTYLVGYTVLVCLEEKITEEMVKKISEIDTSLSWIVFRDSAFGDDINLKTNTMNLLRTLIKEKNPKSKNQKILWI